MQVGPADALAGAGPLVLPNGLAERTTLGTREDPGVVLWCGEVVEVVDEGLPGLGWQGDGAPAGVGLRLADEVLAVAS